MSYWLSLDEVCFLRRIVNLNLTCAIEQRVIICSSLHGLVTYMFLIVRSYWIVLIFVFRRIWEDKVFGIPSSRCIPAWRLIILGWSNWICTWRSEHILACLRVGAPWLLIRNYFTGWCLWWLAVILRIHRQRILLVVRTLKTLETSLCSFVPSWSICREGARTNDRVICLLHSMDTSIITRLGWHLVSSCVEFTKHGYGRAILCGFRVIYVDCLEIIFCVQIWALIEWHLKIEIHLTFRIVDIRLW